jgi:hypothetical protein
MKWRRGMRNVVKFAKQTSALLGGTSFPLWNFVVSSSLSNYTTKFHEEGSKIHEGNFD